MTTERIDVLAVTSEHRRRFNRANKERAAFGLPPLFASIEDFVADDTAKRLRLADAIANRRAALARVGGA